MTVLIADCETNGFLDKPDLKFWCFQLGEADGTDVEVYTDEPCWPLPPISWALDRIRAADKVVFHNGLGFDWPVMERFFPGVLPRDKVLDTLVMARLAFPEERDHSLKAWGKRTGTLKGEYSGNFQQFDQELLDYSRIDITSGRALYHAVKHVETWGHSSALEHAVAWRCKQVEVSGWAFDVKAAQELEMELRDEQEKLNKELQIIFPPLQRTLEFTPKANNKTRGYVKGEVFTKRWAEEFNPGSRAHVAERLQLLGWRPSRFGDDGIPSVDEKTLTPLPYPECKALLRSFRLGKMLGMLGDGKQGWLKLVKPDGRLHGRINPNGTVTGRMAHSQPNVAQADKKDARMCALFTARPGWVIVGADAEGCQLRVLAHYLSKWDNGELAEALVNGDKSKGTDAHTKNLKALHRAGLIVMPKGYTKEQVKEGREGAKTTTYALLFGGGDYRLGETVKQACRDAGLNVPKIPSKEAGILVRKALAQSMKGSDKLVDAIKAKVKQNGYLIGLDGRHIAVRSEHSALNALLMAGEAVIMKTALTAFGDWLDENYTLGEDYAVVGYIHDEAQMECRPELADLLGTKFTDCITQAGVTLGVRCGLAGSWSKGANWSASH